MFLMLHLTIFFFFTCLRHECYCFYVGQAVYHYFYLRALHFLELQKRKK